MRCGKCRTKRLTSQSLTRHTAEGLVHSLFKWRERDGPTGLVGGHADYEHRKRSRFGGRFDKYHIDNADGRDVVGQVSDAHRGYL